MDKSIIEYYTIDGEPIMDKNTLMSTMNREPINDRFLCRKLNRYALFDKDMNQLTPFEFSGYERLNKDDENFILSKNYKYGVADKNGNTVIPFEYDFIKIDKNGNMFASKDGKCGIMDKTGKVVVPFEYEDISNIVVLPYVKGKLYEDNNFLTNGLVMAKKDGKWGCIDENENKVVVDFKYDKITADTFDYIHGAHGGVNSMYIEGENQGVYWYNDLLKMDGSTVLKDCYYIGQPNNTQKDYSLFFDKDKQIGIINKEGDKIVGKNNLKKFVKEMNKNKDKGMDR